MHNPDNNSTVANAVDQTVGDQWPAVVMELEKLNRPKSKIAADECKNCNRKNWIRAITHPGEPFSQLCNDCCDDAIREHIRNLMRNTRKCIDEVIKNARGDLQVSLQNTDSLPFVTGACMNIDLSSEQFIPLADVAKKLPGRSGRRLRHSTLLRWVKNGIAGQQLLAVKIGGVHYTTLERVNEFLDHAAQSERMRAIRNVRQLRDAVARAEKHQS